MSALPVDIDTESIEFDGRWMGRDDLAKAIRELLDGGNYSIGRHSAALEELNAAVADIRTVAFRAPPELADALTEAAAQAGKTPGQLIREALTQMLDPNRASAGASSPPPAAGKGEPVGRRQTDPEIPIASFEMDEAQPVQAAPAASSDPEARPSVAPPPGLKPAGSGVIAGPGALKAAGMPSSAPSVVVDQSLTQADVVTEAAAPEEAVNAVDLTPKSKPQEGEPADAVERRWFGN